MDVSGEADEDLYYDVCRECGGRDFFYDSSTWEATCRECGVVNSYDVGFTENYVRPKTYYKHNYFSNKILTDAMNKGYRIDRFEMREYERLFKMCVSKFYDTQDKHKRKYMINANFVLWKISLHKGKDVRDYIKIPNKNTLKRLEKDWKEFICPW